MTIQIESISRHHQAAVLTSARNQWGDETIIVHNDRYQIGQLPGFIALFEGHLVGFSHYELRGTACEILTLASFEEGLGVGSALVAAVETLARKQRCRLMHLTTTNDNLHALGFYQRRGFHLAALFPGQVDLSRQIKPSIPVLGENQIPIRDELRLEKELTLDLS